MPGTGRSGEIAIDATTARLFCCPSCDAKLVPDAGRDALGWSCAGGHIFAGTRALIAAMLAVGWVPRITVTRARRGGSAK